MSGKTTAKQLWLQVFWQRSCHRAGALAKADLAYSMHWKTPRTKRKRPDTTPASNENNFKSIYHFWCGAAVLRLASHTITCISASQWRHYHTRFPVPCMSPLLVTPINSPNILIMWSLHF